MGKANQFIPSKGAGFRQTMPDLRLRPVPSKNHAGPSANDAGSTNSILIIWFEIATVACGSFAMTLLAHFLLHTSLEPGDVLAMTEGTFLSLFRAIGGIARQSQTLLWDFFNSPTVLSFSGLS